LLTTIYERDDRSPEEVNRTIEIFHRTGAIDKSRRRITALWHRTLDALTEASTALGLDSTANAALHDACALFIPYELRKP
jgi:geranylgeranyl diphosphate synthase type I